MAAYIIVDVQITDASKYDEYRKWSSAAVLAHGAKVLARGGKTECLEGRTPGRIVVLEFPNFEAARVFYASPEYGRARLARADAAIMNMLIVDGV